jgi:hypothetical protein
MEGFSEKLDSFIEDGIISRRHKDIPVGDPLRSYTLEEPAEITVGDDVHSFGAGDELTTRVDDGEVWIVADIRNDTEIAKETRLGALRGDLDGFSVTVFCKEWEETPKGQRVTDFDWHATTIGPDDLIKNGDSRFGVAEFKAAFGGGRAAEAAALEVLSELPHNMPDDDKSFWTRVKEKAAQKEEEADGGGEQSKAGGADGKADEDYPPDGGGEDDEDESMDDADAILEKVRSEMGDDQADVLKAAMDGDGVPEEFEEDTEDDDDMSEAEDGELKAEDVPAEAMKAAGFVTEEQVEEKARAAAADVFSSDEFGEAVSAKLDERMPEGDVATKADVEAVMKAAEDVLTESVPQIAKDASEQTAQKMATGSTPSPSGGPAKDQVDYKNEIERRFGSAGGTS